MPLIDYFFPRRCLGCGRLGSYFCHQCLNLILLQDERICPVCGQPSLGGLTHFSCRRPWSLDGLTTIFAYRGVIKKAIKKLKYRFVTALAQDLVELFLTFCGEDQAFCRFCREENSVRLGRTKRVVLVPIPLHPRRQRWRGFNQTELLGQMISQNLGLDFAPGVLLRKKATRPQTKLDQKDRRENIKGAFAFCRRSGFNLRGSRVFLFDDVWTTGATLREAARTLKRSGVEQVWGLTLAR